MLVLGRKPGESLMIGDEIVITVLAVDGDRIKIGIEAPSEVRVLRRELYETIKAENMRAAELSAQSNEKLLPSLRSFFQEREVSKQL